MSPEIAEEVLGASGKSILIGQLIARLAVKTPGIIYRSQDVLDNIGNDLLASAFTLAAADHLRTDKEEGCQAHWRSDTDGEEEINLFTEFCRARYPEPDTEDFAEAIEVISALEPDVLRKVLGRLVDKAGGLFILQPNVFDGLEGQGAGFLMSSGRTAITPQSAFRFSACVMTAGDPDRIFVLRMLCVREGGPMPSEGQRISEIGLSPQSPTLC
ncbi:hypothetical protein AB9K35_17955 [Leisingera sp. XS_AS12]|uniref:hypothetical protein n=1 Tax=Leisingera sp. XS_AS12 TaxID=3241294 RepID=UPI0035124B2B